MIFPFCFSVFACFSILFKGLFHDLSILFKGGCMICPFFLRVFLP